MSRCLCAPSAAAAATVAVAAAFSCFHFGLGSAAAPHVGEGRSPCREGACPHSAADAGGEEGELQALLQVKRRSSGQMDPTALKVEDPEPREIAHNHSKITSNPFDAIIVGAGLMGSAVAARLAERAPGARILLIEGGPSGLEQPPSAFMWDSATFEEWPGYWNKNTFAVPGTYNQMNCWDPNRGECQNWTWPAEYTAGAYQVRVRGGGGSVNGALHQLPHDAMFQGGNYSGWPAWPEPWRLSDLQPYYEEVDSTFHLTTTPSADGKHYLSPSGGHQLQETLTFPCETCAAYPSGFKETSTRKPSNGTLGIPYVIAEEGLRQSTSSVLLPKALLKPNFTLLLESEVTEVVYAEGRATGVKYTSKGEEFTAEISSQGFVVMCAGAFNTPRLLLKSGITNAAMGKDLSDHAMTMQTYQMSSAWDIEPFQQPIPDTDAIAQELTFRSGGLSQFGPTLTAFVRDPTTPGGPELYDVEIFVNPASDASKLQVYYVLMRPTCSSANLTLHDGVLTQTPGVHLACPRDVKTMQFAQDLVQERMSKLGKEVKCIDNCGSVMETSIMALNHWAGTCALGTCVEPETLRVLGTENVHVADASLLPGQIWAHPAMTLEAMALKAGDIFAKSLQA